MKKFFTFFLSVLAVSAVFAQNSVYRLPNKAHALPNSQVPARHFQHSNSASRAISCDSFFLDYNEYNEVWATLHGLNYNGSFTTSGAQRFADELTSYMDTFHQYSNSYIYQNFDSLTYIYLDANQNPALGYIPLAATTVSLDSLGMIMGITGDSTKMATDSLIFIISKKVGTVLTPVSTVVLGGWPALRGLYAGTQSGYSGYRQIPMHQQFNQGEGFSIRVQYVQHDTSSGCNFAYSFPDSCGIPASASDPFYGAYPSPFRKAAAYGLILPTGVGAGTTVQALDNNFVYPANIFPAGTSTNCRYIWEQNWALFPIISACSDFGVVISASKLKACPQTTVDLTALTYGTRSQNITYTWSAINGTVTATSGDATSVVMGDSANVSVIVTVDDGSATTADTILIANQAIHVKFANPTQTINCGGSGTLIPITSGNQVGRTYLWSPGGATSTTITANQSGSYALTVTNNSGCSATTSVSVVYPNVTNSVSFTYPAGNICKGYPVTLTNTSTGLSGWNATWDMLGNNSVLLQTANANYTYATAGTFPVTLKMDSAGCTFVSAPVSLHIITCVGIDDVTFNDAVSILPNPTEGQLTVTLNSAAKDVTIKVYTINGAEVKSYFAGDAASSFSKNFDFSDLANGTYLLKIQSEGKSALKKFTISK